MTPLFIGLSAFPLTPANADGEVDTDAVGRLVERLVEAGVHSVGLLGSTGIYAYLDPSERARAVAAAVEAIAGRVPLMVGVGALRTSWARQLAAAAELAGADGLLLAPMSYAQLTDGEVVEHYRAVAGATALPMCIYNNPGTTNFAFSEALIASLTRIPTIHAIKMPLPEDGNYRDEMKRLRVATPNEFSIGYSGDWGAAPSLLAGGDAWYSVVGGLLPHIALRLTRAASCGDAEEALRLDQTLEPLWALFRAHGSIRVMYAVADRLSLRVGDPPAPLRRVDALVSAAVEATLDRLAAISGPLVAGGA